MNQHIVIVRHAHRDTSDRLADNGLSDKGREQVQKLVSQYGAGHFPSGKRFLSSPKKRCQETLGPLAKLTAINVEIDLLLDEQTGDESLKNFNARVRKLADKATTLADSLKGAVYLCSHGDLIPLLIEFLTGNLLDLDKGKALVLKRVKSKFIIVEK